MAIFSHTEEIQKKQHVARAQGEVTKGAWKRFGMFMSGKNQYGGEASTGAKIGAAAVTAIPLAAATIATVLAPG